MIKYAPLIFCYFLSTGSAKISKTVAENLFATARNEGPGITNATDSVPSFLLIVPGKSIGLSAIGAKATGLYKSLGKPSAEDASMGGKSLVSWYSKPIIHMKDTVVNEVEIYFTTPNFGTAHATAKALIIRATSPRFQTREQLGVGSALKQIRASYAGVKKTGSYFSPKTQQDVLIFDDAASGIAFEINKQQKCVGITVHKTSEDPLTIYRGIFGDVE